MALQHNITLDSGVNLPASYARISDIRHTHNELIVSVQWWADAQARLNDKLTVKNHSFSVPWQETISLAQAYLLLKAQEPFANTFDV